MFDEMPLKDVQETYRYKVDPPLMWSRYKYDSSFNPNKYKRKLHDVVQFTGLFLNKRREFQCPLPFANEMVSFDIKRLRHVTTKYSSNAHLSEKTHSEAFCNEKMLQKPELTFHIQTLRDGLRFSRSPGHQNLKKSCV
ncbi:hypothetical protein AALO_G00169170 [Alosa alosa]|uniref:Uncharacterized protein n=1 Tax=Alosa alosa TaxID=278164 RepID=A0AAV6GFZ4_9TELE|nr:hypothetical protein AALO_G00169170 [Alosa alosa]